ncbi:MAG: Maf family protein [Vulcanimicrobiaceae bacterium]
MQTLTDIILASASPRRHELLSSLGIGVRVVPSGVDEVDRADRTPLENAIAHAAAKAAAVAERTPAGLVVAADTVVDVDGATLGKPHDRAEAAAMLRRLAGREHLVHTAFALADRPSGRRLARTSTTRVRFFPLSETEIADYVAGDEPLDKAGAYGIQGRGAVLVASIDGDFYTVMGFPMALFVRSLPELGYGLPTLAGREPALAAGTVGA